MVSMNRSQPNDSNRYEYYQHVYHMQKDSVEQLVDVSNISDPILFVDCCGWHYRNFYQHKKIFSFETVDTALNYRLDKTKFDRLIDSQSIPDINWPTFNLQNCVIIFDRSPMLKYQNIKNFIQIINSAGVKYCANTIIVKGSLLFIDDNRLTTERFNNFGSLVFKNFTIKYFLYDAEKLQYELILKNK